MLEEHLRYNIDAKAYQRDENDKFSFDSEELSIKAGVRHDRQRIHIDFSCIVYTVSKNLQVKDCETPSTYSLMTKMMKYKTMLKQGNKQEQLGRCGETFVFLRSLRPSMLRKECFIEFGNELGNFILTAHDIHKGFCTKSAKSKSMKIGRIDEEAAYYIEYS